MFLSSTANTCTFRLQIHPITMTSWFISVTDKVLTDGGTGRCHQHKKYNYKNNKMDCSECCMTFFNSEKTE